MNGTAMALIMVGAATVLGCVGSGTHQRTLAELEETRETLAKTVAAFESYKKQTAAEMDGLNKHLGAVAHALDDANTRIMDLTATVESEQSQVAELRVDKQRLMSATAAAQGEIDRTRATVKQREEDLKAEMAEKARLEKERAAKEAEIKRLTQTHADLTKSLEAEIAKGDIRIKQVRDRLTINMVDRVLFDSGQGQVKPAGLRVLKQVSDILKNVADKQIRIEGHTDNVPIGGKLKSRFPSNWELSTARATSVVRYLIEEGGVDRVHLSAVGYADMRPVASNDTEEGRTANRRIEITLYPKDLSEIAGQIKP
ncbi:MAG: OmpA family protein [Nitrospiraceae bacterium]